MSNRRVHAQGMAVGESHGTAGPCGRRHQLRSAVKPNSQPKSLTRRDRNCFRSLQGRVTTATPVPGNWTSRLCLMTGRREGCVSTILTESDWSIAVPVRHFKGLPRRNAECKPTSTPIAELFVLTTRGTGYPPQAVRYKSDARRGPVTRHAPALHRPPKMTIINANWRNRQVKTYHGDPRSCRKGISIRTECARWKRRTRR